MIAPPRHPLGSFGPLGFPHLVTPTSASKQWVCQGIDRLHKNCLSSYGAVGSVTACPPHYQVFQLYYPLMNFPGIGVALRALGLLHLVSTFILRGRGLLNLLHLRSDHLSTSSPTRSSSLWPIETQKNLHSTMTMTMHKAQQRTAAHCQLGNTTLKSLFSLNGFLGKRITPQATSASSSTIPTTTETSVNTNVTFPFFYFNLPPSLLGSVLL